MIKDDSEFVTCIDKSEKLDSMSNELQPRPFSDGVEITELDANTKCKGCLSCKQTDDRGLIAHFCELSECEFKFRKICSVCNNFIIGDSTVIEIGKDAYHQNCIE